MKKGSILAFIAISLLAISCSNELDFHRIDGVGGTSNLSINVVTENIESKGLVTGNYLDSGAAIGVTVLNTSGGNYDGTAYSNIKFTSSGTSTSQTWAGASTVKLSATEGYCYAYYPYSSSASSITAIPVTAGGTDYLYATKASVNDKSKTASLTMKHALSAIRFALKRGTYGGTGKVTAVSVTSSALGSSGTLNATTGAVTAANKGTAVSQTASLTLSTSVQNVDVVMVPSGTAGTITLSVTIDGKAYTTSVSSTTIAQGSCYTYTITVNAGSLALSGVKVGAWGYNTAGNPTITAAGYTVTFAGSYSDIAFSNSVSGSTVTIEAYAKQDYYRPIKVTKTGSATLNQTVSDRLRTITLSNITSNITVTFSGTAKTWPIVSDGVYAIDEDGDIPIAYSKAYSAASGTYQRLAIVMKGTPYEIAKVDVSSTGIAWSSGSLSAATTEFKPYYQTTVDGSHSSGLLMQPNGSYYNGMTGTAQISNNISKWTSGALSNWDGKTLTSIMAKESYGALYSQIASFCRGSNNQGYIDWYLPAEGQLAFMYMYHDKINNLLSKMGGTAISTSHLYWSSSVKTYNRIWMVSFGNGMADSYSITSTSPRARLIRNH